MKPISSIVLTTFVMLTASCGNGYYWGPGTGGTTPKSNDLELAPTGLVRFSSTKLAYFTGFTATSSSVLEIEFERPGEPLPKTIAVEYATGSQFQSSESTVRALDCQKSAEDLAKGYRSFKCKLPRRYDSYDHQVFRMESLKIEFDNSVGKFTFRTSCAIQPCSLEATPRVLLGFRYVPNLEPAEPNT